MEERKDYQVTEYHGGAVAQAANFEDFAMSAASVVRQINIIQDIMREVMRDGEHYWTMPGSKKPSLLKSGAEKLGLTFRLRPEYTVHETDLPGGHKSFRVDCTLFHIVSGAPVGQGVGMATTMEEKYRFRGGEKVGTGQKVPKEYWNLKNGGKTKEALDLIGGPGFGVGKIDGSWEICEIGEKQEQDNPADFFNTVLKMAKKRAHVDAILTATAASDIFTQDIEDMANTAKEDPPDDSSRGRYDAPKKPATTTPPKRKENTEPEGKEKVKTIEAVIKVHSVSMKEGETNGNAWKLFSITADDGTVYKTFDTSVASVADAAAVGGNTATIHYEEVKNGKLLKGIVIND